MGTSGRRFARRGSSATIVALLLMMVLAGDALAVSWKSNTRFTTGDTGWAYTGGLAVSSSSLAHAVYERWVSGNWRVMYQRTTNGGSSWAAPVRLSRSEAGQSGAPAIEASGNSVIAAWIESDDLIAGLDAIVVVRASADGGATWGDQVQLSPTSESAGPPMVARSGSRVAVTWTDQLTGKVYLRRSATGGATWSSRQLVATTSNTPYGGSVSGLREAFPVVAVASDSLYVGYYANGDTLKVRRSTNDGATLRSPVTLATNADGDFPASIAARKQTVIAGYAAETSRDEWTVIRRSTDKGAHWGAVVSLNPKSADLSWNPTITVRGKRWMAVYEKCSSRTCSASYVNYRASTNDGRSWSSPTRASVRRSQYGAPADVDVATRTLVLYIDYDASHNDVYLRAGS